MALGTDEINSFPAAFIFKGRSQSPIQSDEYNGLLVSQQLPSLARLAQSGRIFSISTAAGTAKAPVATVGTTTAAFALWNGNAVTTKRCLVLIEVEARLVSGTAPVGSTAMLGLSKTVQSAAVAAYAGVVGPISNSGSTSYASLALIGGAITLAAAPVWRGVAQTGVALAVGGGMLYKAEGGIIVPPFCCLGATVLSDTGTTPLWGWTFTYAEIDIDLD